MTGLPATGEGKKKEREWATMTVEEREAAERQKRSFERSLAGPSVGKAGERDVYLYYSSEIRPRFDARSDG